MTYEPTETRPLRDGEQRKFRFENGYGASVVRHQYSYGGPEGLFELAVLDRSGHLTYDTPVTSDVEGWLTEDAVQSLLAAIEALPEAPR